MYTEVNERRYTPLIVQAFEAHALPGSLGLALVKQESLFNPRANSQRKGDLKRGGAYGLGQLTLATAERFLGFMGDAAQLSKSEINVPLMAKLCALNASKLVSPRGCQYWVADMAALYNRGKVARLALNRTRVSYIPSVLQSFNEYESKFKTNVVRLIQP